MSHLNKSFPNFSFTKLCCSQSHMERSSLDLAFTGLFAKLSWKSFAQYVCFGQQNRASAQFYILLAVNDERRRTRSTSMYSGQQEITSHPHPDSLFIVTYTRIESGESIHELSHHSLILSRWVIRIPSRLFHYTHLKENTYINSKR